MSRSFDALMHLAQRLAAIEMLERKPRISSTPTKALRILVVEDGALIAMLYADLLVEMGHVVCAIETTEAGAVAAAARHKPDLMIVGSGLRDGSGIFCGQGNTAKRICPISI